MTNSLSPLRLLLDTHVALWSLYRPRKIRKPVLDLIEAPDVAVHVSVATFWEVAIKSALRKLDVPDDFPSDVRRKGLLVVPVLETHAWGVRTLESHHGDPFDRLLIAQSIAEGFTLVTRDRELPSYGVSLIRA